MSFLALGSEPLRRRNSTHSVWPTLQAMWSGMLPLTSLTLTDPPLLRIISETAISPQRAARCSGVEPSSFMALRLARCLSRQATASAWPQVAARFHAKNRLLAPARELPTGHFALAEVACSGRYAIALAHQEGPAIGLREINRLEAYMKRLGLDPKAHAIHWSFFSRDKGLVLELAGNYEAAAESLRVENISGPRKRDLERVEKKLGELKPGS